MGSAPKPTGSFDAELMEAVERMRDARGWSQAELARRAGVSDKTYSGWKRGKGAPNMREAINLAKALDYDLDRLVRRHL